MGELKAQEAVKPLIELLDWNDERENEYVLAELPVVFGRIGRKYKHCHLRLDQQRVPCLREDISG